MPLTSFSAFQRRPRTLRAPSAASPARRSDLPRPGMEDLSEAAGSSAAASSSALPSGPAPFSRPSSPSNDPTSPEPSPAESSGASASGGADPEAGPSGDRVSPEEQIRRYCQGEPALEARLEPWMVELLSKQPHLLHDWIESYGSPVHLLHVPPFERNVEALLAVAEELEVVLGVYFSRKANKALAFVDTAEERGWGVDTSSHEELRQALDRGMPGERLILTAAIKSPKLLELAASRRVTVALDHPEEARVLAGFARREKLRRGDDFEPRPVALRLSGFHHEGSKLFSRFGFDIDRALDRVRELWSDPVIADHLSLDGLQFHLDGYDPDQRVSAMGETLTLLDALREDGHPVFFVDMGGGLPVRYLDDQEPWDAFWESLRQALRGEGEPVTYKNRGLGLSLHGDQVIGEPATYPFYQELGAPQWLDRVLRATLPAASSGDEPETVAGALRRREVELRCEPGRAALDGAGMTVARVEMVKEHPDGHLLAGLSMNRTQCRTSSVDFLVDPLLVPAEAPEEDEETEVAEEVSADGAAAGSAAGSPEVEPAPEAAPPREETSEDDEGSVVSVRRFPAPGADGPAPERPPAAERVFLTGAYCIEDELLCWRALRCPEGITPGDLIVWPNTAGYFMHFLESASHQFPLAKNLLTRQVVAGPKETKRFEAVLDEIDGRR